MRESIVKKQIEILKEFDQYSKKEKLEIYRRAGVSLIGKNKPKK